MLMNIINTFVAASLFFCITLFSSDYVNNPGFELIDSDNQPEGWSFVSSVKNEDTGIRITHTDIYEGKTSLAISHTTQNFHSTASQEITLEPDTLYILSFSVKVSNIISAGAGPRVLLSGKTSRTEYVKYIITDTVWTKKAFKFTTVSSPEPQILRCYLISASGSVWFDSFSLIRIGPKQPDIPPLPEKDGRVEPFLTSVDYSYSPNRFIGGIMTHPKGVSWKYSRTTNEYFYRRKFIITNTIKNAWLQFGIDEDGAVYINGKEVKRTAGDLQMNLQVKNFWEPFLIDVTPYIKSGKNCIAFEHRYRDARNGILMDLTINFTDYSWQRITGDEKFVCTDKPPAGSWTDYSYNDSEWTTAALQGLPPLEPFWWRESPPPFTEKREGAPVTVLTCDYPKETTPEQDIYIHFRFSTPVPPSPDDIIRAGIYLGRFSISDREVRIRNASLRKITDNKTAPDTYEMDFNAGKISKHLPSHTLSLSFSYYGRELILHGAFTNMSISFKNNLPNHPPLTSESRMINGIPQLYVNDKPVFPIIDNRANACPAGYAGLTKSGAKIFTIWCGVFSNEEPNFWFGPDDYRFDGLDSKIHRELNANPDAYLLPIVIVSPYRWWNTLYPKDTVTDDEGNHSPGNSLWGAPTFIAKEWRNHIKKTINAYIHHTENAPYHSKIIGYLITSGNGPEWIYWAPAKPDGLIDYSPAALSGFRTYLKDFRGFSADEISRATIPSRSERLGKELGIFRDPVPARMALLYDDFHSYMVSDTVNYACGIAKEAVQRKKIVGIYGEYTLETSRQYYGFHQFGKNGMRTILESTNVDFMTAPQMYQVREPGETGEWMQVFKSDQFAGKMVFPDDDTRTYTTGFVFSVPGRPYQASNAALTESMMRRGFGKSLARVSPISFLPVNGPSTFGNPEMARDLRIFQQYGQLAYEDAHGRQAEIAVVLDENSVKYLSYEFWGSTFAVDMINHQMKRLGSIGAPIDLIFFDELQKRDLNYKLYIFLTAFSYTEADLAAVKKQIHQKPVTALWIYASGFIHNNTADTANMGKLTGIKTGILKKGTVPFLELSAGAKKNAYLRGVKGDSFGLEGSLHILNPVFYVDDTSCTLLGVYNENKLPGFAVKKNGESTSIFYGPHVIPSDLLRGIARGAGVHIYADNDDVIDANDHFIMFHAASAGRKTILLPQKTGIIDIFEKKIISEISDKINFSIRKGMTKVFYTGNTQKPLQKGLLD